MLAGISYSATCTHSVNQLIGHLLRQLSCLGTWDVDRELPTQEQIGEGRSTVHHSQSSMVRAVIGKHISVW